MSAPRVGVEANECRTAGLNIRRSIVNGATPRGMNASAILSRNGLWAGCCSSSSLISSLKRRGRSASYFGIFLWLAFPVPLCVYKAIAVRRSIHRVRIRWRATEASLPRHDGRCHCVRKAVGLRNLDLCWWVVEPGEDESFDVRLYAAEFGQWPLPDCETTSFFFPQECASCCRS